MNITILLKSILIVVLAIGTMMPVAVVATTAATTATSANEPAAPYRCPMHPEQTGELNDRCPICNMFINEPNPAAAAIKQATTADQLLGKEPAAPYRCPMHPEQTGELNDRCPICNMFINEPNPALDVHAGHNHQPTTASTLATLPHSLTDKSSAATAASVTQYICPMHPHVVGEAGDTCPICGMDLEAVQVGGTAGDEIKVNVSGQMQQALGMRTEVIEYGTLWRYLKTLGTVEYNQDAISHIHTRVTGWVEQVEVHNVGQRVKKGDLLYQLYSPELVTAQDDYLQALDYLSKRSGEQGQELLRKARLRLQLLGLDEQLVRRLERTKSSLYRVPFYAPADGVVSQLNLRDGMYIQPGDTQIELVDLATVWVIADVFENEQSWLEAGRYADVSAASQGVFSREGIIDYIYPELDPVTRAMQVRVKLDNADEVLRPGSLVEVELYGGARRDLLIVPTEALILTGRDNRVVVQRDDQSFTSVTVKLGMISQGKAEVLAGLQAGDKVVVSGQFLLDSEASIQGSLRRLSGANTGHNH
ncbi:efflux RND transporter periplasmic adaptor subunit [Ferrimonas lipolytica]|uniref:Efflux RND transporter periplasmic adaptor subunit n=1 Tax=Ferrimonas lipolytica TaxID=2724191 RepID=A0A6H1UH09_9GAMM|nr:efflux RND transporter periplasmic adaptor subunit [Ferrimonas lipolytica]QIZ78371.1 efflux RND transporter periplasmic adaptor subunit [Ferrimonas lipolytica]